MGIKTVLQAPYSPDLALCNLWLFPKLRGCRYETIDEMKEAVKRSHKRTSMGPSRSFWNGTTSALQLEEIILKRTRVSCVYLNKSAHTKKIWKLIEWTSHLFIFQLFFISVYFIVLFMYIYGCNYFCLSFFLNQFWAKQRRVIKLKKSFNIIKD